jgi:uncharacterized membrane protein YgcG
VDFIIAALLTGLIGYGLMRLFQKEGQDEQSIAPVSIELERWPPADLRPALLSLLITKRVSDRDIAATLVDLAVRGYLSIEQLPNSWWRPRSDWRLTRRYRREGSDEPRLAEYERVLLASVFASEEAVLVSELKGKFSGEYKQVRELIYAAPEARGWFSERVDQARRQWKIWTVVVLVGSCMSTCMAAGSERGDFAVWLFPFVLGGIGLGWISLWVPRRTVAGSAMLRRALGFRRFIFTAEQQRATLVEQQGFFSELLPYAIAFGAEDKWARVFLGIPTQALTRTPYGLWFTGATSGAFLSVAALSSALSDFGSNVGGSLASTPSSTGFGSGASGFGGGGGSSGGGGGGGGGGGW